MPIQILQPSHGLIVLAHGLAELHPIVEHFSLYQNEGEKQ